MAYEKKNTSVNTSNGPSTLHREENSKAKENVKNGIQEPNKLDGEPKTVQENVFETVEETQPKELKSSLNTAIRKRLAEIEGEGKDVVYPTNEGKWDQALLDRLNKA